MKFEPNIPMNLKDVVNPLDLTEIVSSKNFKGGKWKEEGYSLNHPETNFNKFIIPVDFDYFNLSVITEVDPNTVIAEHQHDEPLFRYIVKGELTINDEHYEEGDWIIIPKDYPYSINTEQGYRTMGSYGGNCAACGHPH